MPVTITYHGDDDLVLEQVCTDGAIDSAYDGSTHRAIENAATAAGVVLWQGADLNMIEQLAAGAGEAVPYFDIIAGAVTQAGKVLTFAIPESSAGVAKTAALVSGAKVFARCMLSMTAPADEPTQAIVIGLLAESMMTKMVVSIQETRFIVTSEGYGTEIAGTIEPGDEFTIWRNGAAWGAILPSGANTGDLSETEETVTGDLFGFANVVTSGEGGIAGTITFISEKPAGLEGDGWISVV